VRATVLRPWYVLGPGHRWPVVLLPFYALAERIPAWRDGALRLGLVRLEQMATALTCAIECPPSRGISIVGVPAIRAARLPPSSLAQAAQARSDTVARSWPCPMRIGTNSDAGGCSTIADAPRKSGDGGCRPSV
jgi:hypothetical protein